jgi:hypothetical protein
VERRPPAQTTFRRALLVGLVPDARVHVPREREGAVHEREMGERLREVAEHAAVHRVVLLRDQAEVVPQREQAVEQGARLALTALEEEVVDEPEAAGKTPSSPAIPSTAFSSLSAVS